MLATLTRIAIPSFMSHIPNFTAINAIALFCGAYISNRYAALLVVIFSVWVGDLFINHLYTGHWSIFYPGFYWQYASYLLITLLGVTLQSKVSSIRLASTCLASSFLFFILSNFGVWVSGLYPLTLNGLMTCYIAAIPFFKNTIISDLFFSMVLFGSVEFSQRRITSLTLSSSIIRE